MRLAIGLTCALLAAVAPVAHAAGPATPKPAGALDLHDILVDAGVDVSTLAASRISPGFPTMPVLLVDAANATAVWQQLRDLVPKTGRWPVFVGATASDPHADYSFVAHRGELFVEAALHGPSGQTTRVRLSALQYALAPTQIPGDTPARVLARASAFDLTDWIAGRPAALGITAKAVPRTGGTPGTPTDPAVAWTPSATTEPFASTVVVALPPTAASWAVPAYLPVGGWGADPAPEVHVAMLHRWHDRYGADLVGLERDTMALTVARPAHKPATTQLAWEQFWYCTDSLAQGVTSIGSLAKTLDGARGWSFAWPAAG